MNQLSNKNTSMSNKYLEPVVLSLLLVFTLAVEIIYLVVSHFGDIFEVFIYSIPLYVILSILSFIAKHKFSWTPISMFLFAIYCVYNTYFNSSVDPFHIVFIILLGIVTLLDFSYLVIDKYIFTKNFNIIKIILLIVMQSIITVSSTVLLFGIFRGGWSLNPYGYSLNQLYVPLSIIVIAICSIYYSLCILNIGHILSKEKVNIIKGLMFTITFIITLFMMIISLI